MQIRSGGSGLDALIVLLDLISASKLKKLHCTIRLTVSRSFLHALEFLVLIPVFIVFKAKVDMSAFRTLADLASDTPKPLLRETVYLPSE
jgi:hypothetical protein